MHFFLALLGLIKLPHILLKVSSEFLLGFIWASTQENLSLGFVNNKGAGQPVHPHRLISAFVIRFLESIISKLATGEISIF